MLKTSKEMTYEKRDNMRGGEKFAELNYLLATEDMNKNGKMFATIELPVGGSVGDHEHVGEDEIYYILSGKGEVSDNGVIREINAGEVLLTKSGEHHSIKNIGDTTLKFVAVIILI